MKKLLIALALLAFVVAASVLWLLRQSPGAALPQPNGYDDFVKASQILVVSVGDWDRLKTAELKELVATNAAALGLVRQGLTKQCRVPPYRLVAGGTSHMKELSLAQAFMAESRLALETGQTNHAALSCLDCIRLGQECSRSSPLIDSLVGIAVQNLGVWGLEPLVQGTDAATAKKVASGLEECIAKMETVEEVLRNERRWVWSGRFGASAPIHHLLGWKDRQKFAASMKAKVTQSTTRMQQTAVAFAAHAYELEKGRPPSSARNLAPDYLKAVPKDPTTGRELELTP